MESVKDHYDSFLGEVYSWILGDFDKAYERNSELFANLEIQAKDGQVAVDLGCGPGCQSLPLAEIGYDVVAIDFCQALLDELGQRTGGHSITRICDDILNFRQHLSTQPNLVVCMGDTLVHLPDMETASSLIRLVCESLEPGGIFIYAIRDYISLVPTGAERFVPVRSSEDQIFTCFLDYREDVVHVHDILHRKLDGEWQMTISDYQKLRLDSRVIDRQLEACGLAVTSRHVVDGMITVVAEKT